MAIICVLVLAFLFFRSSLFYYFVSDDFLALVYPKIHPNVLQIDRLNSHFSPFIWLVNGQLIHVFGSHPFFFHLFALCIHLITIYLVYRLTYVLIGSKLKSIIAALLFAFFFGAYEVVFWYGATNNSLMVTFYILGLLFFIQYVKSKNIFFYFLFLLSFLVAYGTHEYALSLIPTAILYWWLFSAKKKWREFGTLFSLPIFMVISTTVMKAFIIKTPLMARAPSILHFIAFVLRSFVYLFIPSPLIIDRIPNFGIPVLFLIILFFLLKFTKSKQTLFLLLWATFTVGVYSLTSAPQARYFYLSFVPVVIYIMSVIKIKKGIAIAYLLFILISGLIFLQNQKQYWRMSSDITKNVIGTIRKDYIRPQKNDILYFVNMPDSSNDSIWKAYVFRVGLSELLANVLHIYPKKVLFLRSFTPSSHTMEVPSVSPQELKKLVQNNVIIFVYKEDLKNVVLLK